MSSPLLDQAKQGNPEAIATLLNKKLRPKGIIVQVSRHSTTLDIVLTGKALPPQASAIPYLKRSFAKLGNIPVGTLMVTGQKYGTDRDMWTDTIALASNVVSESPPSFQPDDGALQSSRTRPSSLPEVTSSPTFHSSENLNSENFNSENSPSMLQEGEVSQHPAPSDVGAEPSLPHRSGKAKTAKGLFSYWLHWQLANIVGGLLLMVVLVIVALGFFLYMGSLGTGISVNAALGLSIVLTIVVGLGIGGLFVGSSQTVCMKQYMSNANAWRWATCAGFTLGGMLTTILQTVGYGIIAPLGLLLLPHGIVIGIVIVMLGGVVYGAITASFQWLVLRNKVAIAYPWIIWSSMAGGISFLLAAVLGAVGAWWGYSLSNGEGFDVSLNLLTGVVGALVSSAMVSWLVYHGISGGKMARFLQELDSRG